jgi:O-antigen ligase
MTLRHFLVNFFYILLVLIPFSMEMGKSTRIEFPLEFALVIYNFCLLYFAYQQRKHIAWLNPIALAVAGIFAAALLSILPAVYPMIALKASVILGNYILAFFGSFLVISFTEMEKRRIIQFFAISYFALLSYAAIRYLYLGIHYQNSYLVAQPFARGHTLLIAMGFPLWILLCHKIFTKQNNVLELCLFVIYSIFVSSLYSRLYWVLLPLFIGFFILKYWKKWRWFFVAMSSLLLIVGYFTFHQIQEKRNREQAWLDPDDHNSWFVQVESIIDFSKNESNTERANRWKVGALMFESHPLTGVGLNNYATVHPEISQQIALEKTSRSDMKMNAHQWYLGTLFEQGIVGILALLALFLAILSQYKRISFMIGLIIFHYIALGLIEDFILLAEVAPVFWICLGWFAIDKKIPTT